MIRVLACGLVVAAAWASGCVQSKSVALGGERYAARADDAEVAVFVPPNAPVDLLRAAKDSKPVEQVPATAKPIGRVDAEGAQAATWSAMIKKAKEQARKLGGDAIVIGEWDKPVTGASTYAQSYGNSAAAQSSLVKGKTMAITVIKY